MANQNALNLKLKGLYTDPNNLSAVPTGALFKANNVNIDRDDIVDARRGSAVYGAELSDLAKNLFVYKDRLLVHHSNKLSHDNVRLQITSLTSTTSKTITAVSGSPASITSNSHGFIDGNIIIIEDCDSLPSINGRWVVTNAATNTFELVDGPNISTPGTTGTAILYTTTATATTSEDHNLVPGKAITITGADQVEYNVENGLILTTPTTNSFTYSISNITISPATSVEQIYLESGTWTDNTGTLVEPESGRKVRSAELNSNLYLTSSNGVKKLTAPADPLGSAGIPRGLNTSLSLVNQAGFFTQDNQVGYRVVWGIRDANNNLLLGAPSQQEVIACSAATLFAQDLNQLLIKLDHDTGVTDTNYAISYLQPDTATGAELLAAMSALCTKLDSDTGVTDTDYNSIIMTGATAEIVDLQSRFDDLLAKLDVDAGVNGTDYLSTLASRASQQVQLTIVIPSGITTSHFFQVYRTPLSLALDASPGDEGQLCYEDNPSSTDISNGYVTFTDILSESFLGASLYTNATQEGINQSNDQPPFAMDMAVYKNSIFFANTKTKHKYELTLLGSQGLVGRLSYLDGSNIGNISNVTGNTWRYPFTLSAGITLSEVTTSHKLVVTGCTNSGNNGTFPITNISIASGYVDVTNALGVAETASPGVANFDGDTITVDTTTYKFRADRKEVYKLVCPDDSAISAGDYFVVYTPNPLGDPNKYVFWYYKGGGTPPAGATDAIYIKVDISAATTDIMVATATQAAVDALQDFVNVTSTLGGGDVIPGVDAATGTSAVYIVPSTPGNVTTNIALGTGMTGATFTTLIEGYLGELASSKFIGLSSSPSPGTAIDETARSFINVLNKDNSNTVVAYYTSIATEPPGKMLLERETIVEGSFNISASDADSFNPDISTTATSDNETLGNRVFYSKVSQPEAVPTLNYLDIGSSQYPIQRIVALRDSLFVFKRDGIYRITGEISSLQQSLFDSSAKLVSPESVIVGNNQVFLFSDQGVIAVSDTGITVISRSIERTLLPFYGPAFKTLVSNYAFGVFYETERKYILWLPSAKTDTYATQAYAYNTYNNTWTRYPIAKTCGILNPTDDKLYLGSATDYYIEKERKDFHYRDQADRRINKSVINPNVTTDLTITNIAIGRPSLITTSTAHNLQAGDYVIINGTSPSPDIDGKYKVIRTVGTNKFSILCPRVDVVGTTGTVTKISKIVQLNNVTNVAAGDILVQPYFLNTNRFNSLLGRLDIDTGLNDSNYYSSLHINIKSDLPSAIVDLADKLSADPGVKSKYYATLESDIKLIQAQFNYIVNILNNDTGVTDETYESSLTTLLKEVPILSVDTENSTITIPYDADLAGGSCYIYKAIETEVEWVPQHAGDASYDKQHTEAQIMFSELNSSFVYVGFKTEASPYKEEIIVNGSGNGAWGTSVWGERPFGIASNSEDLRTLIPTEKQRGRFLIPSVRHNNAYETYSLTGLSIIFRTVAHRVNN